MLTMTVNAFFAWTEIATLSLTKTTRNVVSETLMYMGMVAEVIMSVLMGYETDEVVERRESDCDNGYGMLSAMGTVMIMCIGSRLMHDSDVGGNNGGGGRHDNIVNCDNDTDGKPSAAVVSINSCNVQGGEGILFEVRAMTINALFRSTADRSNQLQYVKFRSRPWVVT